MNRLSIVALISALGLSMGCNINRSQTEGSLTPPKSASGVTKTQAKIKTGSDGLTVEQRNVKFRLEQENDPGSIKHLYVISAMSGQVIIYSTVKGKVTSSGKRLTPTKVQAQHVGVSNSSARGSVYSYGQKVNIGGYEHRTSEVLQDDGTYGSSIPYLYWWDTQDRYHQHYVSGGQIIHVGDQPMPVKNITINLEQQKASVPDSKAETDGKEPQTE